MNTFTLTKKKELNAQYVELFFQNFGRMGVIVKINMGIGHSIKWLLITLGIIMVGGFVCVTIASWLVGTNVIELLKMLE